MNTSEIVQYFKEIDERLRNLEVNQKQYAAVRDMQKDMPEITYCGQLITELSHEELIQALRHCVVENLQLKTKLRDIVNMDISNLLKK
jgi:hypothetical protein